jgi:DNA-nicking Smr family endonuclease
VNRGRRPGTIGPEDHALWDEVKKSVKPLRRSPSASGPAPPARTEEPTHKSTLKHPPARAVQPVPAVPALPPLTKLDRRARQRVGRGTIAIDARLDLHGLTQERARSRLQSFLAQAQARGAGLVLVITGKGKVRGKEIPHESRGVLHRQVPLWLELPEFRPLVIGFEPAGTAHGGGGALYVRVRRRRN